MEERFQPKCEKCKKPVGFRDQPTAWFWRPVGGNKYFLCPRHDQAALDKIATHPLPPNVFD